MGSNHRTARIIAIVAGLLGASLALLALSAWRANDTSAARQWLDMIANDGQTPPSMRSRAAALQALLPPVAKS